MLVRTAEGGFNENSFGDSAGSLTGNLLIGLGAASVWWLFTRTNLSANWKWFDWLNAASYVMVFFFFLHLTIPKWVENVSRKQQSSVAPEKYDWDAIAKEAIANNKVPAQDNIDRYKAFEKPTASISTPQLPEGFEWEKAPIIEPAKPEIVQGSANETSATSPRNSVKALNWGPKEQKCQDQYFAAVNSANQDMPIGEYAEFERKARQRQRTCNGQ